MEQAKAQAETRLIAARIPVDLSDRLATLARTQERSVSAELRLALRAHLDAPGGSPPKGSKGR